MDTEAKPIINDLWLLTDLLGRKIGTIVQASRGFIIEHAQPSMLDGSALGPHATLEELSGPLPSRALSVGLRITDWRGRIVFDFARPV